MITAEKIAALSDAEKAELAALLPPTFGEWLREACPDLNWDYPHIDYLTKVLQRVANGEVKRLIINLPPQHGKSSIVTRFVAYMLEINPALRVMLGAYSIDLVQDFSVTIRDITRQRGYTAVKADTDAKGHWRTTAGGQVHAVSVGGAATGNPSDLTVIDDPYKDLEDADSETSRKRVQKVYQTAWKNRLSKDGIVIVVHTRWGEADLTGYLKTHDRHENWEHVNLPAIAEEDDPLGRRPGEALCPALHPLRQLLSFKLGYFDYEWAAIYQGNPTNERGDLFKVDKIQHLKRWPTRFLNGKEKPLEIRWVRSWDRAATKGGGDYTVGMLVGRDELDQFHFRDCVYGQWDDLEVDRKIDETATKDGYDVPITLQQDPGSAGKTDTARIARRLNALGFSVESDRPTGSKTIRARGLSSIVANGDLFFWEGDWNDFVMAQMRAAPHGKNDDAWDAGADGVNYLSSASDLSPYLDRFKAQTPQNYGMTPEGLPEPEEEEQHWLFNPSGDTSHVWQCETCKSIQSSEFDPTLGDRCQTCKGGAFTKRRLEK